MKKSLLIGTWVTGKSCALITVHPFITRGVWLSFGQSWLIAPVPTVQVRADVMRRLEQRFR